MEFKVILAVLIITIIFIGGCITPETGANGDKDTAGQTASAEARLSSFGDAVIVGESFVSRIVGPEQEVIELNEGVEIEIPAGAFSENTGLVIKKFDLELGDFSFYVKKSFGYILSADGDVSSLAKPVVLKVPNPQKNLVVTEMTGKDEWQKIEVKNADPLEIEIGYFSDRIILLTEPVENEVFLLPETETSSIGEGDLLIDSPDKIKEANDFIEKSANEWEKAFLGIGESGEPEELCRELKNLIEQNKTKWKFKFREDIIKDPVVSSYRLGRFLFTSAPPSEVDDDFQIFNKAVLASQEKIKERILKSEKKLSPADILKIAIEENNNDAALGVLATHNFLKELAQQGREMVNNNIGDPFTGILLVGEKLRKNEELRKKFENNARENGGEIASHIKPWRITQRSKAGSYDKFGPLYHIFAAMTAQTYMPHINGGSIAVAGEAAMRATGITGDVFDPEKGLADACGVEVGKEITKLFLEEQTPIAEPIEEKPKFDTRCESRQPGDDWSCFLPLIRDTVTLFGEEWEAYREFCVLWLEYKNGQFKVRGNRPSYEFTPLYLGCEGDEQGVFAECTSSSYDSVISCIESIWQKDYDDCVAEASDVCNLETTNFSNICKTKNTFKPSIYNVDPEFKASIDYSKVNAASGNFIIESGNC